MTDKDIISEFAVGEWEYFHDVLFDATGRDLNQSDLELAFILLPIELKLEAVFSGMCDTGWQGEILNLFEE